MGRDIKKPDDWVVYIPEAFDNRSDPDPVTVEIHWLSGEEYRRYRRQLIFKAQHGDMKTNAEEINARIIEENVRNVQNYSVDGVPLRTGKDLFERGEPDFVEEILDAVSNISRLEKGLAKKQSSSLGSSQVATLRRDGIA